MSHKSPAKEVVIDLTGDASKSDIKDSKSGKKTLKQLRLPFAPVNKTDKVPAATPTVTSVTLTSSAKRKRDKEGGGGETTPSKLLKEEEGENGNKVEDEDVVVVVEEKKTPRRIKPIFVGAAATIPTPLDKDLTKATEQSNDDLSKDVAQTHKEVQSKAPDAKKTSPEKAALQQRARVAIAKLSVDQHELGDEMETAVARQDFLRAAELKATIDGKKKVKDELQAMLDAAEIDGPRLEEALKNTSEGEKPKFETPKPKNRKRRSAAPVKTPGSTAEDSSSSPGSADKAKVAKTTPVQEAKRAELQKKKEEREREKVDRERQREELKAAKEAAKKEKEEAREAEKVEKEKLRKQKEEEKEAEKRAKEETRLAEQQRKVDKLEEKKRMEETERLKKEKVAKSFTNFFIKKESVAQEKETEVLAVLNLFRVKKDMRLAPATRRTKVDPEEFDKSVQKGEKLYLARLKDTDYKVGRSVKTWPVEEVKKEDDEVEVIEEEEEEEEILLDESGQLDTSQLQQQPRKVRAKLLQFIENQRPPFYGTWSKRSKFVGPRRPLGKDEVFMDYEYDSDDDWEEEEQGESLSDEEKDKEDEEPSAEEEDEDDGFFVGHGVLDKDELHPEDDDDEEVGSGSYDEELEKKKQTLRALEFEEQYKKRKPVKLKARTFGCMWVDQTRTDIAYEQLFRILNPSRAVVLLSCDKDQPMIPTTISSPQISPSVGSTPSTKSSGFSALSGGGGGSAAGDTSTPRARKVFPEEHVSDLVRLIHCNANSKMFLAKEFTEYLGKKIKGANAPQASETPGCASTPTSGDQCDVSKTKILEKIVEVADYKKFEESGPLFNRKCWVVKREVLEKLGLGETLQVPNNWTYSLEQPHKADLNKTASSSTPAGTPTAGAGTPNAGAATPTATTVAATATPKRPLKDDAEEKKKTKRESIQTLFLNMTKKGNNSQQQEPPQS